MTNKEKARAAFEKRADTWDPIDWDYTEWEELFEEIRVITGQEDIAEFLDQFYY